MNGFLRLEDCLAPLPLPAVIALFMVLGLRYLGGRLVSLCRIDSPQPIQRAAGFILAAGAAGALVQCLSLLGAVHIWVLRVMAWSLLGLGILELATADWGSLPGRFDKIKVFFSAQSLWVKAAIGLMALTAAGLLLAALGPPTDSDSLDYHLGVPLDILRRHGASLRPDWLHARLTGLGESLNLLGLAGGTDNFGAALQVAGLVIALTALWSLAETDADKVFLAAAVLGCPVLAFLVPNQKPQMLPTAATTLALIMLAQRFRTLDHATLVLAFGCTFFAISCKYSFLLSGSIVLAVGFLAAARARLLWVGIGAALTAYLVFGFPVHLEKYLLYGDPVSPFLERFKAHGDAAVIRFAAYLRGITQPSSFFFPLNMVLPDSPGRLTTVLGAGILLLAAVWGAAKESQAARILLISALLAILWTVAAGQMAARFFFEPYLWLVAASALASWSFSKDLIFRVLVCQLAVMALISGFGAASLFPGALTASWREKIMARSAYSYPVTRWLHEVLPGNALVLGNVRSAALMPRPALSSDLLGFFDLSSPGERQRVREMIASSQINTLVVSFPMPPSIAAVFYPEGPPQPVAGPREFRQSFRNPWSKEPATILAVYPLDAENLQTSKTEPQGPKFEGIP